MIRARLGAIAVALLVALATAGAQEPIATVEDLRAAAAAGGRHVLAATTFTLDAPIEVALDLELVGAGRDATVIDVAGRLGFRVVERAMLRLEALTVAGAGSADYDGPGSDLVLVRDARLAAFDVAFARAPFGPPGADPDRPFGVGTGLVLRGAAVAELGGVEFRHHQLAAVELYDRAYLFADGADVVENHVGMLVEGDAQLVVQGGRFARSLANALVVRGRASASVADSSFEDDGYVNTETGRSEVAVGVAERARAEFLRTTFRGHPDSALLVLGAARVTARDVRIEDSGQTYVALNVDRPAVAVRDEGELRIEGGTVADNRGGAFDVAGTASLDLVDVAVERNGGRAHTWVRGGGSLNVIRGRFVDNDFGLMLLREATAFLAEVEIAANGLTGVRLSGDAVLKLFDGVVRGHDVSGVEVDVRSRAEIRGTRFADQPTGLVAHADATAHLEGVAFEDHARVAFDLRGSAHVVAVDTTVTGSPEVASVEDGAVLERSDAATDGEGEAR
ncbi:MAG: right-handed parallel beta-helix repeat-containing protein [Trueperaceae bacterium]